MKAHLSSPLLVLFLVLASSLHVSALGPASNDNFINAFPLTGPEQSASNGGATVEPGEPSHNPDNIPPTHSVWWRFTAPLSGVYQVDTSGSDFDTVLAVYTGTTVKTLTRLATNDDFGASGVRTSQVRLFFTKGVTYRIAVDGYLASSVGTVKMHVALARYYTARTYQGYIAGADKQLDSGGMLSFSVVNSGAVTGRFYLGARSYPFTAAVDDAGTFSASVLRTGGLPPVSLSGSLLAASTVTSEGLSFSFDYGAASCALKIGGLASTMSAYPTPTGDAALAVYYPTSAAYTTANPCPRAGRYPFTVTGAGGTGYGAANLVVSVTGVCTASGRLGDGTAFAFSAPVVDSVYGGGVFGLGTSGGFIHHQALYVSRGRLSGETRFDASATPATLTTQGNAVWIRPDAPGAVFMPVGFNANPRFYGWRYVRPSSGRLDPILDANSGTLHFAAQSATYPTVSQTVALTPTNTFTYTAPNANLVKLAVNPGTCILSGSLKFTGAPALSAVYGVFIRHPGLGNLFLGYATGPTGHRVVTLTQ